MPANHKHDEHVDYYYSRKTILSIDKETANNNNNRHEFTVAHYREINNVTSHCDIGLLKQPFTLTRHQALELMNKWNVSPGYEYFYYIGV